MASRNSLWLGKDHLLSVTHEGYSESYKRFYYPDIQAITFHKSLLRTVVNAVFLPLSLPWLYLLFLLISGPTVSPGVVAGVILTGIFPLVALVNTLLGSGCACYIHTAVQTERLYGLSRIRTAKKAIALLRVKIEEAQGGAPAIAESLSAEAAAGAPAIVEDTYAPTRAAWPGTAAIRPYASLAFPILLGIVALDVGHGCLVCLFESWILVYASYVMIILLTVATIAALIKQNDTSLPNVLKNLTWTILAYLILMYFVGIGMSLFASVTMQGASGPANPARMSYWFMYECPIRWFLLVPSMLFESIVAVTGLIMWRRFRLLPAEPPPVPPPVPPAVPSGAVQESDEA